MSMRRIGAVVAAVCLATAGRAAVKTVDVGPGAELRFADQETGGTTTTVSVGDTVTWVWRSSGHSTTRTGAGDPWDSGIQTTPFTFSHTFTVPGTYPYHCTPHQAFGMTGTVVVQGGPGVTTTTTTMPSVACSDPAAAAATRAAIARTCDCGSTRGHGAYVACVAKAVSAAVKGGTLPAACRKAVRACAARSTCGRPGAVTCCRTKAAGATRCSIKRRAACKPPRGGTACVGSETSCCDACTAAGCAP